MISYWEDYSNGLNKFMIDFSKNVLQANTFVLNQKKDLHEKRYGIKINGIYTFID